MGLLTTTIGAYPKPEYVKLPDWFGNLDTSDPTRGWAEALNAMGDDVNAILERGTHEAVNDQVDAGIDIPQMVRLPEKITFTIIADIWKEWISRILQKRLCVLEITPRYCQLFVVQSKQGVCF